jgi:RNA-directed DNA polymerase
MRLHDLQRKRDGKATAAPSWRFWGLDVHGCTRETLRAASRAARANDGAPGRDGVTLEDIEGNGGEPLLAQRREALVARTDHPMRARRKERPQAGGMQVRVLGMPTMRARVVQGAAILILTSVGVQGCQSTPT